MDTKVELRARLKKARLELTDAERTLKSRAICENLKPAADWAQVKTLHYFEPLRELMEPDISDFVTWLEDTYPAMELFTPRLINGEWEMVAAKGGEESANFDAVIVPMLGFDDSLNRIGYGGGYYDKFLVSQPKAKKIGVCFELGKVDKIPAEPYDIPLDTIVTEDLVK